MDKPSLPRPYPPVSLYARGPICLQACQVPKTGITLTLKLISANTNPYPNFEALDVNMCTEIYFQKPGQIGPRAKNNRANRADPFHI
jgi:hypothetical protein